jgi:hypothetical protein
MNPTWSGRRTLGIALAVTAAVFILGMGILFLVWLTLRLLGSSADFWAMTEAVATAVAAATVFGAGVFAYLQLAESNQSRYIAVADRLFEELNAAECIAARRWIFQNLPDDPATGILALSEEGHAAVKRVLNSLDRVAFLTQANWIPEELIMPWMNPMIAKSWLKLKPYVEYESRRRHEPDYYQKVRELGERCLAWRAEHLPEAKITWVEHAL